MTFRRHTFPEVLDNLLTSITKGVAGESHPFPPSGATAPPYQHTLQQAPVASIVSVYGSRNEQPHEFRPDKDYKLLDKKTLAWQQGAELPDPGTLIQVNYYPQSAQPVLTDLQTGSIIRTLAETVALEMSRLSAQLEIVYQSGYIDTASGRALDNVVALLGITRVRGGQPAGEVELTRAPESAGTITIPAGTRVTSADGNSKYETVDTVTMAPTQNTIRVGVRDLLSTTPLPADTLTLLPIPVDGISRVTNPAPTVIATQDETDEELRTRAKSFLHGSERATLGAIKQAIASQGISADVEEVADTPGRIEITPHEDATTMTPERQERLLKAIQDARPAGVLVILKGVQPPRKVNLDMRLATAPGLLEQDLRAVQRSVHDKLADYFARLTAAEAGSLNRIIGLVLSIPMIKDVQILRASWTVDGNVVDVLDLATGQLTIANAPKVLGELRIADPNLPTRLNVVVIYPKNQTLPDKGAIQAALNTTLAYLNTLNGTDLQPAAPATERAKRMLSFGKLLLTIPLPVAGKPTQTLEEYDKASSPPSLPDENSIKSYQVKFVFTPESTVSSILSQAADPPYVLTPGERLSLNSVEISEEASNA